MRFRPRSPGPPSCCPPAALVSSSRAREKRSRLLSSQPFCSPWFGFHLLIATCSKQHLTRYSSDPRHSFSSSPVMLGVWRRPQDTEQKKKKMAMLRNLSEVAKVLGRGSVLEQLGKPFAATTRLYHEKVSARRKREKCALAQRQTDAPHRRGHAPFFLPPNVVLLCANLMSLPLPAR